MPATIQFVDSIASSPTVRLDINDGVTWFCEDFSMPPPRLRRSEADNAMRDGGIVGSSTYENRTLTAALKLINTSTEDAAATEMQKLWRELDRPVNYIRYQRETMTKPVFFKVFRSDASDFEELWTTPIARDITVEILAEPFALGLRETLGPFTVNNDPAAGSNGCFVDITGVIGDVTGPCVVTSQATTATQNMWVIAARSTGTTGLGNAIMQAESLTFGTDTTNPGGGPDAAMSGTGTNNYARTSFATSAMATRLSLPSMRAGTYRIIACVRRSDTTSAFQMRWSFNGSNGDTVTVPVPSSASHRMVVDLGLISIGSGYASPGYGTDFNVTPYYPTAVQVQAARPSGSGTLDWDFICYVPADEQYFITGSGPVIPGGSRVIDGYKEAIYHLTAGSVFAGGTISAAPSPAVGGFPRLVPNQTNRVYMFTSRSSSTFGSDMVKTDSQTVSLDYWPRYLTVRPVSS